MYRTVEEFAYATYNHVRPHSYNGYRTPYQARTQCKQRREQYEEAYLTQYTNIREARRAIGKYIHTYNFERCHSAINNQTSASCYYPALLIDYAA